jgi:hypothetical protein
MKEPQSKPLMILDHNKDIGALFAAMELEVEPLAKQGEKFLEQLAAIKKDIDAVQKRHWSMIEDKLLADGHIDSKEVSLSVRDGVLYMDPKRNIRDLGDLLGKLFT